MNTLDCLIEEAQQLRADKRYLQGELGYEERRQAAIETLDWIIGRLEAAKKRELEEYAEQVAQL